MLFEKPSVSYVDHMGDDSSIVNAARVSFNKEIPKGVLGDKDIKLIEYLAKHNHWSPFAHTSITLRVANPIFLARQLVKHQVGGVWNEESRRYVSDDVVYFMPKKWRRAPVASIKQGSGEPLTNTEAFCKLVEASYKVCDDTYKTLLAQGVCPEQARMVLPLGAMTHWIWTGSLMFWARVYHLRADEHAQKDLAPFVQSLDEIMNKLYPVGWRCLKENH